MYVCVCARARLCVCICVCVRPPYLHSQVVHRLSLNTRTVHSILSVQELYDRADSRTYGTIITNDKVLHGLDETTLNVT